MGRASSDGYDYDDDNSIEEQARRAARFQSGTMKPLPRPRHTRKIALANQKGGVGKTTSTVNLAWALSLRGQKVLVVDLDPQGNASTALSAEHRAEGTPSTYEVIIGEIEPKDAVQAHPSNPNMFTIPATIDLAGAEMELANGYNREYRVAQMLGDEGIDDMGFDYIFIDCPPSLGLLTINGLTGANEIIIPIQCEFYALEGVTQLTENVRLIREALNPNLDITGVLLTMYDSRTNLSHDVENDVRESFGSLVFDRVIPRNVRVSEAPSYGQTVIEHDAGSPGSAAYMAAVEELARREPESPSQNADPRRGRHTA